MTGESPLAGAGAVVLGAGQGMGEASARALHAAGMSVACVDLRGDLAAAVAADIGGVDICEDVTDRAALQSALDRAKTELPPIRAVIDVVGMATWGELENLSEADWERDFGLNLKHVWHCLALAGPLLGHGGGGSIVCIASVSGMTGAPRHGAYGAAKAGVMALVRTAAIEYAPTGVRVNAISPGAVLTPRIAKAQSSELIARQAERIPLGRLADPSEIADLAVYLVGPQSSYITGATIVIDGGVSARYPYATPTPTASRDAV